MISRTSIWAAAARALGSREPDTHVRNPDWLAGRLLGLEELALLGDHPISAALEQPFELAAKNMEAMRAARILIPRTHFIDSRLESAVREGATQIVILGAGFDSRAYRFAKLLQGLQVYEVDHPEMQDLKARRVHQVLGELPVNANYLPVDFLKDSLGNALFHAGYRTDRKTFFIWEGVTMYLTAESVRNTVHWIAENALRGSRIVFDYTYETFIKRTDTIDIDMLPEATKQVIMRHRTLFASEPWIFGLPYLAENEFLSDLGLDLERVLGMNSAEAVTNYLTRADGSIFASFPATKLQAYLILEALVPI